MARRQRPPLLTQVFGSAQPPVRATLWARALARMRPARLPRHRELLTRFAAKIGLELGGPSAIFSRRGLLPVYPAAARIDNCNFSLDTVWHERQSCSPHAFQYDAQRSAGRQFVAEVTALTCACDSYDFVLCSHVLEHSANPLQALTECRRVLRSGGDLVLILPHKDGTFDHRRPVTPLEHLLSDFRLKLDEHDLTHLEEVLQLHDLQLDPEAGSAEQFRERCLQNFANRCIHHHVFDTQLAVRLVDEAGLQIEDVQTAYPFHIIIVATKLAADARASNEGYLRNDAPYRSRTPFPSDRLRP